MKHIIVVNSYIRNKSQLHQAQRIAEEFDYLGVDCNVVKNSGLAKISGGEIEAIKADVCVFLDKDRACARLLEKSGIRLFNKAEAIELCDDKMLTHIALSDSGISMPDTIYAPLCYYENASVDSEFLNYVEELGYPIIAKKCYGSLGEGVNLLINRNELAEYENKNKLSAHFFQKFVGIKGVDVRVIVIGGKYVCAMKRTNEKDFRSNIGLGGRGEKYEADRQLIELCETVAKILKLDYCGIDILIDGGKYYVCEVNSNAFFAEAERICEINIARKYVEHILNSESAELR